VLYEALKMMRIHFDCERIGCRYRCVEAVTAASAQLLDAIRAEKTRRGLPVSEDDRRQIADEIAEYCQGFGCLYGCVEAAVTDVCSALWSRHHQGETLRTALESRTSRTLA